MNNQELIRKADIALADLATAGKLNPQQSDRFLRTVIDQPTILRQTRTVSMANPEMWINKIGFGSRIMKPATSATALDAADRSKPDLAKVSITTKEVIAEVHIPYEVLEDNIERGNPMVDMDAGAGGLHQTIVDLIAERAALDFEELGLKGDTGSGDAYLALCDGFLKLATANTVAVGGAFTKNAVKAAVKAMPDKYLRNRARLIHFVTHDNELEMRDQYGTRQTAMGDSHIQGNMPIYVFGSKVEGAALMPSANGLFTDPENLIFGLHRDVSIEYDKDIRARVFVIVLTCRLGFQIEEVNAVVKYTGIS